MDIIKYEILEDGTISIETDAISGKNHVSADQLLEQLSSIMGGSVDVKKKQGHAAHHAHPHDHSHSGEHHHH